VRGQECPVDKIDSRGADTLGGQQIEKMDELDRYIRQMTFHGLGKEGQRKLLSSKVLLVGCGALGSAAAVSMVRSGIGHLTIVDRDIPELVNLHRQFLYDEEDIKAMIPKAIVAAEKLAKMNSQVKIEPKVAELRAENIEKIAQGVHLVIDGTDNLATRYLINDFCVKNSIPWIYGGVIGASGMMMVVEPGKTACLRCLFPEPPAPGSLPSCETEGVLNPAPLLIGALESIEAIKILIGSDKVKTGLTNIDLWEHTFSTVETKRNPHCPTCGKKNFEFLNRKKTDFSTSLCGRNAVQISPAQVIDLDLQALKQRLEKLGKISFNGYLLEADLEGFKLIIFPDGRAIIQGTTDETKARSLYNRYLGR